MPQVFQRSTNSWLLQPRRLQSTVAKLVGCGGWMDSSPSMSARPSCSSWAWAWSSVRALDHGLQGHDGRGPRQSQPVAWHRLGRERHLPGLLDKLAPPAQQRAHGRAEPLGRRRTSLNRRARYRRVPSTPTAMAALKMRAPSMCKLSPCLVGGCGHSFHLGGQPG